MKLLKSWISYKSGGRLSGCLKIPGRTPHKLNACKVALLAAGMILAACEEKIPTIQNQPESFFNRQSLTIPADSIRFAQGIVQPSIGQSAVLFVGDDENVRTDALMKFGNVGYFLPDSIDQFLSAQLILYSVNQYRLDGLPPENLNIGLYQLLNDGIDPWTEDSSYAGNFNIEDYTLSLITEFSYPASGTDTVRIALNPTLIAGWYDGSNSDYSLVFRPADTTIAAIQGFYSVEAATYPRISVEYVIESDTSVSSILPTEDLSLIRFKKMLDPATRFNVSSGRASYCLLRFDFENLLTDDNTIIARADLKLKIDRHQTQNYRELFNLYVNVVDSNIVLADSLDEYGNPVLITGYNPINDSYTYSTAVSATEDSVTISIKSFFQGVVSGYTSNYGIVVYTLPSFTNIASLSMYNAADQNPEQDRPRIQILTMKEK
ncbi:MAG TPA: hypothetical protein ENN20_11290 [Candidatus Marinimicrobia bacterium]|nr:hypothetical protein [Candidatus Neomarinimicrobiota bacterium]